MQNLMTFFTLNQKVATHPCKWQWQWWQWCLWKWLWLWWWDDGDDLKDTVEWSSSLPCPWLPYLTHIYFLVLYLCVVSWQIWNKLFCSTDFLLTSTDFCWLYTDHHHHQITLVVYQRNLEIVQPEPAGRGDSSTIQVKKKLNKFFLTNYTKF